jgi:transglutaminase-like putative cysteine protease
LRAGVVLPAGSAYTVLSERSKPTAALLRMDGDVSSTGSPSEYLKLPDSTTDRVRDLARQLAAGSPSTYDTVRAIESWLAENVAYDLDAPVPRDGVDAVDHFLFETQRGFCEHIATATAVMLRSLGVYARVATGYVPSDRDEVAGVWISRARDAHAWVEVHFPSFGWVAFDPTASVPLSGEAGEATIGGDLVNALGDWVGEHISTLTVGVIAFALAVAVVGSARRWRDRRRRGRWGVLQDRFVAAAVRRGAPRTSCNAELAAVFDSPHADAVARSLDSSAFAASRMDDDEDFEQTAAAVRRLESSVR